MGKATPVEVNRAETSFLAPQATESQNGRIVAATFTRWLTRSITSHRKLKRTTLVSICAAVFLAAIGVRLLHWQDSYAELAAKGPWMSGLGRSYRSEAFRMLNERSLLFPREAVDPGDARLIIHPPGYSALLAAIFAISGDSDSNVRLIQIILDALSAVIVFLIAAELLSFAIAATAASLVALSPHFAHYSLWISPDSVCILPILIALYLVVRATKRPRIITIFAAGAMLGLSCWLRANAVLLAPFLAAVLWILIDTRNKHRYVAALVGAVLLVIAPITIRNWILFHHFIPVSITGGENLAVGIADCDKDGRFGMPVSDRDVALKEAQWYNRPDYAYSPWLPDGVARDQARYKRGLEVISSHPGWFLGIMAKRALFMLSYNGASQANWPFNTSTVPIVARELPAIHWSRPAELQPVWSAFAGGLLDGSILSSSGEATLESDGKAFRIADRTSEYCDQFTSRLIAVKPGTDYLLALDAEAEQGKLAAKVTSADRHLALASEVLEVKSAKKRCKKKVGTSDDDAASDSAPPFSEVQMTFASGDRNEVRFVVSNNGQSDGENETRVSGAQVFELGATPYQWTRYPRVLIRGLQKSLFKTQTMLPLVLVGVALLALARRGSTLIVLLAVPAYYLCAQSALSTEYRYILAIHYCLFIFSGVALACAAMAIVTAARWMQRSGMRQSPLTVRRAES